MITGTSIGGRSLSTEQIAEALDHGDGVVAIRGPHSSLKEVSDMMEDYWETIMGD